MEIFADGGGLFAHAAYVALRCGGVPIVDHGLDTLGELCGDSGGLGELVLVDGDLAAQGADVLADAEKFAKGGIARSVAVMSLVGRRRSRAPCVVRRSAASVVATVRHSAGRWRKWGVKERAIRHGRPFEPGQVRGVMVAVPALVASAKEATNAGLWDFGSDVQKNPPTC